MQFNTPILFLIFNRPKTTNLVFEEIKKQKPKFLFLASDGPRKNILGEVEIVNNLRSDILNKIDWDCEIKTLFRQNNLGCKFAVSSAIAWFFENVEQGIILEDDCLPDSSFFGYCEELLDRYKNNTEIVCISGDNFLEGTNIIIDDSYYFSNINHIWGWATWRRAWKLYDIDMKKWQKVRNTATLRKKLKSYLASLYFKYRFLGRHKRNKISHNIYLLMINNGSYNLGFC